MLTRRSAVHIIASAVAAAALGGIAATPAFAAEKVVKVGINLSLTGADAESGNRIKNGAVLALEEANAKHEIPGYKIEIVPFDDATPTAGQYDPAQAATNARKMVSDKAFVAMIGPQMSGAGKAMAPILSQADLATVTPSSTNPDLTDPNHASEYMPAGKPIYFRTVTTDAFQGPNLANYFADQLHVKSVYVVDDSGAYGVGIADSFQKQAEKKGIKVLGRDRLDPKASDYTAVLTKIKQLNPDAIYYGGVGQAAIKLAKEGLEILPPKIIKGGGDGLYGGDFTQGAGTPAFDGWYMTIASPHMVGEKAGDVFVEKYKKRFGIAPEDYSITAYDAALVVIDAIKKVAHSGKPVAREAVRDAIQTAKVNTIQGPVSFDQYGDLNDRTISIFQGKYNKDKPLDDIDGQTVYIGVAPQS
jgi:branched-chain amino acid transport system substrate-binding protein